MAGLELVELGEVWRHWIGGLVQIHEGRLTLEYDVLMGQARPSSVLQQESRRGMRSLARSFHFFAEWEVSEAPGIPSGRLCWKPMPQAVISATSEPKELPSLCHGVVLSQ